MKELRIEDLNCYRGSHLVLKRLNFSINSGETLLVRGDNGSGKTTPVSYTHLTLPTSR